MLIYYRKIFKSLKTYYQHSLHILMQQTSLHGLKFVADSSLTLWERGFFLCYFMVAFATSTQLVKDIYDSYENTPIIIGTNPESSSIVDIPFPAVTICNLNNLKKSKVSNYSRDTAEGFFTQFICNKQTMTRDEFSAAAKYENTTKWTLSTFTTAHSQPCSEMFLDCRFNSIHYHCNEIFWTSTTDDGICCTFNGLDDVYKYRRATARNNSSRRIQPVDWSPETGWAPHNFTEFYPTPPSSAGILMGLSLTLNADIDEYYCSKGNGAGFKIGVRSPLDARRMKSSASSIPLAHETLVRIVPSGSEAASNLHNIPPIKRQCYFNKERKLLYHRHYMPESCKQECEAAHYIEQCDCVLGYMPRIYANVTECSFKDLQCVFDADITYNKGTKGQRKCNDECLPLCKSYSWTADAFPTPFSEYNFSVDHFINTLPQSYIMKNVAVVLIYYRREDFYAELKNVYIGLTEFISNSGGILGLFMGFSVMSIAEIIYFMVLRPISLIWIKYFGHKTLHTKRNLVTPVIKIENNHWLHTEIYKPRKNYSK